MGNNIFQVWYSQPGLGYYQEIKVEAEWVRIDACNENGVTFEINTEANDVTGAIALPGRVVAIVNETTGTVTMDRRQSAPPPVADSEGMATGLMLRGAKLTHGTACADCYDRMSD